MIKLSYISAVVLFVATSLAQAQTAPEPKLPGDQGVSSVNKNLEKNPDSKGLQNAAGKLEQNQEKHREQMEKRTEKREEHMKKKAEHVEMKTERREAMDRPAKIERPEKMERPGK